jgi:predicted molibdopterin-dependent oxidoreductase YjgC
MKIMVDGVQREVEPGSTVLEAAPGVPTLCFDERQAPFGACRVCLVSIDGRVGPACTTVCREGMTIDTQDADARRIAKGVVELVVSEVPELHGELAEVAAHFGIETIRWPQETHPVRHDLDHPYLAFRHELCISCGRCVRACDEVQGTFALTATGRGFEANIAAGLDGGFVHSACVACGACADTCPTDAITEHTLL